MENPNTNPVLVYLKTNYGLKGPYKLIYDVNIMPSVISMGISAFEEIVSTLLEGDVVTGTTRCVAAELGSMVGGAVDVVGQVLKCAHKGRKHNSCECILGLFGKVNPLSYVIATTSDQSFMFSEIYGLPVIAQNKDGVFELCCPSFSQTSYVEQVSFEERQAVKRVDKKKCIRKIKSIKLWTKKRAYLRSREALVFYMENHYIEDPINVFLDARIVQSLYALGIKDLEGAFSELLQYPCNLWTTQCVNLHVGRRMFLVLPCTHEHILKNSNDCLRHLLGNANPLSCIIATVDPDAFNQVEGTPIITIEDGRLVICNPSVYQVYQAHVMDLEARKNENFYLRTHELEIQGWMLRRG